jgi:hypothetical protein
MKLRIAIVVLMVLVAAGVSYERYGSGAATVTGGPHVNIASKEHSFGTVKPGTPLKYGFEVKNDGDAVLEIKEVNPACGCTTTSFDKTIASGKSGLINLAIEHTEAYAGELVKTARVVTNDATNKDFTLTLRATFAK